MTAASILITLAVTADTIDRLYGLCSERCMLTGRFEYSTKVK